MLSTTQRILLWLWPSLWCCHSYFCVQSEEKLDRWRLEEKHKALLLPGSSKLTVFAQLGSRRFSRKINCTDFYGIPMCFMFQMKQCQCHYLMFLSMKNHVMLILFHPLSMDTLTILDTPTTFLLWIKPASKNPHRKQNGFRCLNDLYSLAWEQWNVCACITQKGPSKPIMQQTHDAAMLFLHPSPCFAKVRMCIILFTSEKVWTVFQWFILVV